MTHPALTADQAIEIARWIESCGMRPTPLHVVGPDGQSCTCPKGRNCGKSAGKHNIAGGWQNDLRGVAIFEEMKAGAPRFDKEGNPDGHRPPRTKMNVGILTGAPSGIVVLDIDVNSGGFDSMKALIEKHGALPDTFIVKTGTGGFHYYFQIPAGLDVRNSASKIAEGVDIRGNGGMVVAPGSISWAGPYTVAMNVAPAPMPDWLIAAVSPKTPEQPAPVADNPFVQAAAAPDVAISAAPAATSSTAATPAQRKYAEAIVRGELQRVAELRIAGWSRPWDVETFQAACQLIELANAPWAGVDLEEIHQQFLEHCPPQEPGYIPEAKWQSALQRIGTKAREAPAGRDDDSEFDIVKRGGPPDPMQGGEGHREGASTAEETFSNSDLGNAHRLIRWYGNAIRYAEDAGTWLTYSGQGAWALDSKEVGVEAYMKSALGLALKHEAPLHSDTADDYFANGNPKPTPRERFYEWMLSKSEMYARITAGISMARSDVRMRVSMLDFDVDPMIFNAANCAVNLATGEQIAHAPELMLRQQSRIAYNPDAQCPMWEAFLARTQPDPEMRAYLQTVLGYSMTGRMDEQVLFVHNGPGATGKTTFLEVVKSVMGSYGQKLERATLMSKKSSDGIPADVARMAGKRFLAASESKAGGKLDDERIKELVGGDTQTARHLHKDFFEFDPSGKIHIATNHLPEFESGGDGMGRRFLLVPWEQQIPKAERDKTLKARIIALEAEGVLAWLIRGAMQWAAQGGLITPAEVVKRSEAHIREADPVWPFIHERLIADPHCETEFTAIYGAYESWCSLNGQRNPMSGKALSMALSERLGHEIRAKNPKTRRSVFRLRLNLMAVPTAHEKFFVGEAR